LAIAVLARPVLAADPLDDSRPMLCAPAEVTQCGPEAGCEGVPLDEIDLPAQLRVDFKGKQLRAVEGERTSPIQSVSKDDAVLVVQGSQNGRGWSLVVDRASGRMSAAAADAEGAFFITGTCSAEPR